MKYHARWIVAAAALAAALAAGGAPAIAQYQPVIRPGECSYQYNPVCGVVRDRALITYSNVCHAKAALARIVAYEACAPDCPTVYRPVCARDANGKRRTFANECTANKAKAQIIRHTRCLAPSR